MTRVLPLGISTEVFNARVENEATVLTWLATVLLTGSPSRRIRGLTFRLT